MRVARASELPVWDLALLVAIVLVGLGLIVWAERAFNQHMSPHDDDHDDVEPPTKGGR